MSYALGTMLVSTYSYRRYMPHVASTATLAWGVNLPAHAGEETLSLSKTDVD